MNLKRACLCLATAFTLFTACSDDNNGTGGDGQGGGRLIFRLNVPGAFMLRSAGADGEGGGAGDRIAFYQFGKQGDYEQRYVLGYEDAVSTDEGAGVRTYALELNSSSAGEKRFVVVEAGDETQLPILDESHTMDDLLRSETATEEGQLQPPFVMSNAREEGCPYVTVPDVESDGSEVSVKLKRRVARFDLLNDPSVSGIIINKVYVKNRRTRGFVGDVDGSAGNVATDVLEIPASELANGGKSFYLYPTTLTSTLEQDEKTVVWATTRLASADVEGPTLYLDLAADRNIEANYLYQLNTKRIAGSAGFDITVEEWQDGTSLDWVTVEDGISVPDERATLIEGTEVKGTYVKITPEASMPYTIRRVVTDFNETGQKPGWDGELPSWLTVSSSTVSAGNGFYRHEMVYTVTERPADSRQFAVTYLDGRVSDEDLLVIGFADPYPGTPLPCLSWGDKLYSPIHAKQTTYLAHNRTDKAYFCGAEAYTFDTDMSSMKNDVAVNPCPEGWRTLDDAEAKDYILWVGEHLKSQVAESVYTYNWFDKAGEGTHLRILAGYPKSGSPTAKDLAAWGTWPNVAWVNVKLPDLTVQDQTFGDEWTITGKYGIPYRCVRESDE